MAVDSEKHEILNVRETARRLGVHENTIRNWARSGVIPTARVPGSRFHRFYLRDVERLERQRGATVSTVEQERRMVGPELVDASQLAQWPVVRQRHAQEQFPELVRRLLAATPGITNISVRSGDGVSAEGWDGRGDSVGTTFLPPGSLCVELGVGSNPKSKADSDYRKRREKMSAELLSNSVFIFITPRRWPGAQAWSDSRRAEGIFANVRVLDADDLEGWLRVTPSVHHWISEQLGRRPNDAETLEQWWTTFQGKTHPSLPAELFLVGREAESDQVSKFFAGPPDVLAVQADWRDEAIAFVCASVQRAEGEATIQPALVVSSQEAWDRIVEQPGRLVLVALFTDPDIASAERNRHHVLLPLGRDQLADGARVKLPRPSRTGAAAALEAAGIRAERAYQLAALARRSMPSLVRKLARDTRFARPPWSQPPDSSIIAPLMLAGSWTQSEADTEAVSRLADASWSLIEQRLLHWLETHDPPFVRPSTQWHLASNEEAFLVLHHALTRADLVRWHEIALDILNEIDTDADLPPEDQPIAGLGGASRMHSPVLRRGLAEGVALVGSLGQGELSDGRTGEEHARSIVRELLARATRDSTGRLWRSLSDVLPLLAEGAPESFLDAIHQDLDQSEPVLKTMFQDGDRNSWLYSSSPHTGLLWALETLAWSPEYLLDSARALARLQAIDPGGRLMNRPVRSLGSILVPWIRQTGAHLDTKLQVVDAICKDLPNVGWELILALWPEAHGVTTPPSAPRFHDWSPERREVPVTDWIAFVENLVRHAIALAGTDAARWTVLSQRLGPLSPGLRAQLLEAIAGFAESSDLPHDERLVLWETLRKEVGRHRQFASAEWSMDEPVLQRMESIVEKLKPEDSAERLAYLFDWHPTLGDVDPHDFAAYERALNERRKEAVAQTIKEGSLDGLRKLAERSSVPGHVGWMVGLVAPEDFAPNLFSWLDSDSEHLRATALGWARQRLGAQGTSWLLDALSKPELGPPERRVQLALCAPATAPIWDALSDADAAVSDTYWERVVLLQVEPDDVARAVRELLRQDRPWIAIDLLAGTIHGLDDTRPTSLTSDIANEVLRAALRSDIKQSTSQAPGYELGLILDYLDREGADPTDLARYEFLFFRLLEDLREPRALFAALGKDAAFFVDLVSRVYRGHNEPQRKLDDRESEQATHAWWVLQGWRRLPGLMEDGRVDGTHLKEWVTSARLEFTERDRVDIGDELIGQVLAASPQGKDEIWPAEPVRDIIETIGNQNIDSGLHTGVINDRGVTSRGVYDGGRQEWQLATQYREWARSTASSWPRTSRLLRGLAESYESEARQNDAEAVIRADTD
jgi:excisionase family DNA binding protein